MNLTRKTLFLLLLFITQLNYGQTGPWAKYDQKLKDDALYREASAGNLSEVKSIIEGGGNIHVIMEQTKSTILMAAAGSGKIEIVKFLLDKGADPMAKDWWNYTALDKARFVGAKDIEGLLQLYMKKFADQKISVADKGYTNENEQAVPEKKKTENTVPLFPEDKVPVIPKPAPVKIDYSYWPSFGFYKGGDSIIYWVPTGWRKGVIKEVGVTKKSGKISVDYSEKKYLIDPDAYALSNDWYEWSGVVHPKRQPFWTSWFIGIWKLGEVNAHNNEIKNGKETDSYYFQDAMESLIVLANGTYTWKTMDKKTIKGQWVTSKDHPGIVLLKAYRKTNWELRNHTSVDDWFIRKLDIIELKPSANVGTIKGKRASTLK